MEDETLIGSTLLLTGIFVILIGFLLIIISIIMGMFQDSRSGQDRSGRTESESYRTKVESKFKGGGVIMIGPIPIIFGSDKESAKIVIILAIILMLLSLLFFRNVINS
jgi:uncharacterized protein (TIGR00304 family)